MGDRFSSYHPAVNFAYFTLVLLCAMCLMHPVSLVISLGTGLWYRHQLGEGVANLLKLLVPMMLLAAIVNPLFNHQGGTILTYLPSDNPLTLESIVYGLAAATLLGGVVVWFSCYSLVMTSDQFIYLFGRVIPALSLVLSMTLRFVPRFQEQLKVVEEGQRCLGRDGRKGGVIQRLRYATTMLSAMVTWSLENAVETADSMRSRGYGLPHRTAFSIYRFEGRDGVALVWIFLCGLGILVGWLVGTLDFRYFPTVQGYDWTALGGMTHLVYLALCLTPVALRWKEGHTWRQK